jgi:site-specific recombinase XerD
MLVIFFKIGKGDAFTAFEKWKTKNFSEEDNPLKAKGKQRSGEKERERWAPKSRVTEGSVVTKECMDKKILSRKRRSPQLSEADIQHIDAFAEEVRMTGKKKNTVKNYVSDQEHWKQYFLARNWDPLMKEDDYAEKCRKVISYIAYERVTFKLLARSIKRKLSGVAWYFVKNFQRNPLHDLEAAHVFLRDLSSKDPPPNPKIPATPQLVELTCTMIDQSSIGGAAVAACICLMFWIMLRSVEILKPDIEEIDPERVITWGDIIMRRSLGYEEEKCNDEDYQEGRAMTVKIVSYKNDKIVATRTIEQNDKSPTCPVKAIKLLHAVLKAKGVPCQANRPVCQLEGKRQFISRTQISELLKAVAIKCGCNPNKFASHSLRRGGASAYAAAGVPDEDIKRFGRWLSDAYKLYVMLNDTSILSKGHMNPAFVVPRYEKN